MHGGTLAEHQGINLPGVAVSAPALTAKDREDLAFGVAQGVDYSRLASCATGRCARGQHLIQHYHRNIRRTRWAYPADRQDRKARSRRTTRCYPGGVEWRDGGARRPGRRDAAGTGAAHPKAHHQQRNDMEIPVITATQMLESMITNPVRHAPRSAMSPPPSSTAPTP